MAESKYNPNIHSYVMFEHNIGSKAGESSFEGPCAILHHLEDRVWVGACYIDFPPRKGKDIIMVNDGSSKPFDETGACIASIHIRHVTRYLTENEAENVMLCMDADAKLLSYAK